MACAIRMRTASFRSSNTCATTVNRGQRREPTGSDRSNQCNRKIGLCGQAPSDYPEFATFLVECGIDSMSLNPDVVLQTTRHVIHVEDTVASASRSGGGTPSIDARQSVGNTP